MTLREWQAYPKNAQEMIVQASSVDGSDAWQPFPIGMSWQFVPLYHNHQYLPHGSHTHTVLCSISPDTDQRRRPSRGRRLFLQSLKRQGIPNYQMTGKDYFQLLPQYKFIISPEGNGIDCHRHYEALMAGCIPIMEDNEAIRQKYEGCPVLYTKDYSKISEEYLQQQYPTLLDKEYDFSCLFLSFYSNEQQASIKKCGNFWVKKLLGYPWYR